MPPQLALLLTTGFVLFLFWRDVKEKPPVTGALWVPLLWVLILGSRGASGWLSGWGGTYATPDGLAEGSPLDAATFAALEVAGLLVLVRRRVSLPAVLSRNPWLGIYLGYCALAILWSDFPFVAFKRWLKVLGHPILVLVVVTEPDPREALSRLMKRAAYVLVPFSILLIKYYPALGRSYNEWTGSTVYTGVTRDKNLLGADCLLLGLFFSWHLLCTLARSRGHARRDELILSATFLCMIGWLLLKANSATSLMALVVGIATVLVVGRRFVDRQRVGAYLVAALVIVCGAEFVIGVTDTLLQVLGRESTLTGRTDLWAAVLEADINPLVGAGFESFWLGDRATKFWSMFKFRPNQAHNGYLETYLNLGWIGLILMVSWMLSAFQGAARTFRSDFDLGRFQLGVLASLMLYNVTEGAFRGLNLMWFAFYLAALNDWHARRSLDNLAVRSVAHRNVSTGVGVPAVDTRSSVALHRDRDVTSPFTGNRWGS